MDQYPLLPIKKFDWCCDFFYFKPVYLYHTDNPIMYICVCSFYLCPVPETESKLL